MRERNRVRPRYGKPEQEVVVAAVLVGVFAYLRFYLPQLIAGRRGGAYVDPDFWPGWLLNAALVFSIAYLVQMVAGVVRARTSAGGGSPRAEAPEGTAASADRAVDLDAEADRAADLEAPADRAAAPDADVETHGHAVTLSGNTPRLLAGFVLLWAYIFSMSYIGFVPATIIFSVVFLLFLGERRWPVILGFPVVLLAALVYTFTRLLVVPLPRGVGPFLELSTLFY